MAYHINEELSELLFTVINDNEVVITVKDGAGSGSGGSDIYIIKNGEPTKPTDSNVFSALRTREELEGQKKVFLSKLNPDTAQALITFMQGANFGDFVSGLAGRGAKIDEEGHAEMRSLRLWEGLEVPELRYNRVSVYIGIRMDTFGGGIIENVVPDTAGEGLGTATLKLEAGEYGAVEAGDLMMGIWHDPKGDNESATIDDHRGNFSFAGFKTVYFMVTGVSGAHHEHITYMLRSKTDGGNGVHPFAGMHFAGRGNIYDEKPGRQSFVYTTTEYSVALTKVNTWNFSPYNYYEIHGKLDGFSMPAMGTDGKEYMKAFSGYGQVFGNAYMFGKIDQFEHVSYHCIINQSANGVLMPGEKEEVSVTVVNGYGADVTEKFSHISVLRNTGNAVSDELWNAQPEHENSSNPFILSFDDLGIDGEVKTMAVFEVIASDEVNKIIARQKFDFF